MSDYLLSEAAAEDMRGIIRYTLREHGYKQALKYSSQIERCAERLAKSKQGYKKLPDINPELRYTHCEHHYIFGLIRKNQKMLIVAILHERMDLIRRVTGRLL